MTTAAIEIHKALLRAERAEALLDEAVELLTPFASHEFVPRMDIIQRQAAIRAFLVRLGRDQ